MRLFCAMFGCFLTQGFQGDWWIYLFRFVLLFSYIIPISLRVNLDMGKSWYSHCIEKGMRSCSLLGFCSRERVRMRVGTNGALVDRIEHLEEYSRVYGHNLFALR